MSAAPVAADQSEFVANSNKVSQPLRTGAFYLGDCNFDLYVHYNEGRIHVVDLDTRTNGVLFLIQIDILQEEPACVLHVANHNRCGINAKFLSYELDGPVLVDFVTSSVSSNYFESLVYDAFS